MITCIIASFRWKATVTLQVRSRHCYTCSPFPGATKNGTSMQRGPDCHSGSQATAVLSASARSPVAEAPTNRPAPPPFSSIMARRRRWLAAMNAKRGPRPPRPPGRETTMLEHVLDAPAHTLALRASGTILARDVEAAIEPAFGPSAAATGLVIIVDRDFDGYFAELARGLANAAMADRKAALEWAAAARRGE